jgi:hypothetical protein
VLSVVIKTLEGRSDRPQTVISEHRLHVFGIVDENKVIPGLQPVELDDRPIIFVQLRVQLNKITKIVLPYTLSPNCVVNILSFLRQNLNVN